MLTDSTDDLVRHVFPVVDGPAGWLWTISVGDEVMEGQSLTEAHVYTLEKNLSACPQTL